ncbi:hypothetical protein RHMOL_Rhmol10G0169900 [Rhododendron molle]|nr:hypothetical protein RHMOL_Rhmol10G0169900 [Rhododendron molle]
MTFLLPNFWLVIISRGRGQWRMKLLLSGYSHQILFQIQLGIGVVSFLRRIDGGNKKILQKEVVTVLEDGEVN